MKYYRTTHPDPKNYAEWSELKMCQKHAFFDRKQLVYGDQEYNKMFWFESKTLHIHTKTHKKVAIISD